MGMEEEMSLLAQVQEKISDMAEDLLPGIKIWRRPTVSQIREDYVEVYVSGNHLPVDFYIKFYLDGKWIASGDRKKIDEGRWKE